MGIKRFPFGIRSDVIEELRAEAGVNIDGLVVKNGILATATATAAGTAGTSCVSSETGLTVFHKSVLTVTSLAQSVLKGTGSTGYAGSLLYTFPLGVVKVFGVTTKLAGAVTTSWSPTKPRTCSRGITAAGCSLDGSVRNWIRA